MEINFKKVAFWGLLAAGVGCGVGAVFVPPLVAVSVACLSGAAAVAQAIAQSERVAAPPTPVAPPPENLDEGSRTELDLHLQLGRHRHRDAILMSRNLPAHEDNKSNGNPNSASGDYPPPQVRHRLHPR